MSTQTRKMEFVVSAKDEFSATFGKAQEEVKELRKQLNLPLEGELGGAQKQLETAAIARIRKAEAAGGRARINSILDERLFGGGGGGGGASTASEQAAAKPARFSAGEQAIRDAMATRIRAMRDEARATEVSAEANRRLFGEVAKVTTEIQKSKAAAGGLLEILRKFGTSNGTDAIFEKISKVAPKLGLVMAATKGLSLEFEYFNYRNDVSRHNDQKNLSRQLADEQRGNENKRGIFIAGGLVAGAADFFNIGGYHDDKVAIEELEDATKAQDAHTAAMEKRAAIGKQVRESSLANADALKLEIAAYNTAAERVAFLTAQEQLRLSNKRKDELAPGVKVPDELKEEITLRHRVALTALKDLFVADVGRSKSVVESLAGRFKDLIKADFDNYKDATAMLAEAGEIGLRAEGKDLEADVERLFNERARLLAATSDAGKRRAIDDKYDALERQQAHDRGKAADAAEQERQDKILHTGVERLAIAERLRDAHRQELEAAAEAGDVQAGIDAKRLAVTSAIAARRRELNDIIASESATGAQRGAAFRAALNLPAEEALRRQLIQDNSFRGSSAAGDFGSFTNGHAQASREQFTLDPQTKAAIENLRDSNKNVERFMEQLLGVFKNAPAALRGLFASS